VVSGIVQRRLQNGIEFEDSLHGFRPGRGTGTATLTLKLIMEKNLHGGQTLFQVFLDLKKAYDTLDRDRTLLILEWQGLEVVPRQSGYCGQPIPSGRGVTQGDIVSPTVFNIIVDAVVCCWRTTASAETVHNLIFADDGWLASPNADKIQESLECLTDLFRRLIFSDGLV
jgi:hypothetical protein